MSLLGFQVPGGQPLVPAGDPRLLDSLFPNREDFCESLCASRRTWPLPPGLARNRDQPWPAGGAVSVARTWRFWFPPAKMAPSQLEFNSEERKGTALPSTPTHYQQQTEDWAELGRHEQVHPDRIRRPRGLYSSHPIPSGPCAQLPALSMLCTGLWGLHR